MIEKKYMSQCISPDYCKGWNAAVDAIGRCKDCMWSREPTKEDYAEIGRDVLSYKDYLVCEFAKMRDGKMIFVAILKRERRT